MTFIVREMSAADRMAWIGMRDALGRTIRKKHMPRRWMPCSKMEKRGLFSPRQAMERWLASRKSQSGNMPMAVTLGLSRFLEGIWVRPKFRRQGIGARLIRHIEAFLVSQGFRELGSDTQIDNLESQIAHRAWGFSETERVVYFRKDLTR